MTKEEAIWILENRTVTGELKPRIGGYTDLYDFCLEALKQPSVQPQSTMGQLTDAVQSTKDCISRQAAIDAIESAFDRETILNRFVRKIAISAVRKLPSAQPEIIRCKDCRYWDTFPSSTAAPDLHECKTGIVMHWHTKANDFCSRAERRQE